MKKNNIGYLLREGVRGVFLHGFMSFAAIWVTVACLLIMGTFALVLFNLNEMIVDLEQNNQVLVYVDETYSQAEAKSVGSQINMIENVQKAEFVSRGEALEDFLKEFHDDDGVFTGLDSETLRDRYVVTMADNDKMRQTCEELRKIDGVADLDAHYEISEGFQTIQNILNIVSFIIIAVLFVVSMLIISNTVKLAMYDRKEEIAIMKMVGATNGFIRLPFVVEGFTLGMLGAALAFFAEWSMYDTMVAKITTMDSLQLFSFVPFKTLLFPMVLTFCAAGLFVGIVGSWTSIRKFMNV